MLALVPFDCAIYLVRSSFTALERRARERKKREKKKIGAPIFGTNSGSSALPAIITADLVAVRA